MQLVHAGMVCSSQQNSDRFFMELLGLAKLADKTLPASLAGPVFTLEQDLPTLKYGDDEAVFEVFVHPDAAKWASPIAHACLALADRQGLVDRCLAAGLEVRRVAKGEKEIVFVKDFDGNLYEINDI